MHILRPHKAGQRISKTERTKGEGIMEGRKGEKGGRERGREEKRDSQSQNSHL